MIKPFLGPPDARPSKLVEKILNRIRVQERLKRQGTGLSLSSSMSLQPSNRPTLRGKAGFASIVNQAMDLHSSSKSLKGAKAFRAAVQSVLSPANREYMAEQARKADQSALFKTKKRLVIGGKTLSINEDDLSVVDEEAGTTKNFSLLILH